MDGATVGMIGGIAGGAIGVAGGVIGTWASLKRAKSPAERRLVVRTAAGLWTAVVVLGVFLVLMLTGVVPYWVYLTVMCAFFIGLGPAIALVTRRERELHTRQRESAARWPKQDDDGS